MQLQNIVRALKEMMCSYVSGYEHNFGPLQIPAFKIYFHIDYGLVVSEWEGRVC